MSGKKEKRQNNILVALLILICAGSIACHRTSETIIPTSEATPDEQKKISETLALISDITGKLGNKQQFDRIPIIVTTEDWKALNRIGYCSLSPRYIAINRTVMAMGGEIPDVQPLFNVLLHEIGHCYFDRPHEPARFYKDGFLIVINNGDKIHPTARVYGGIGICVSVMCTRVEKNEVNLAPYDLREYYVAELLQPFSTEQLSDFERLAHIQYVPKSPPPPIISNSEN